MQNAGWYVWEPPGKSFTVLLALDLLDRLKAFLEKDFAEGREAGGVLLGRSDVAAGRAPILTVDDFLPLESDRRHGDFYSVTGKDRQLLRAQVSQPTGPRESSPIGFFRSHLRPGLSLDSSDFSIMREFFPAADRVALLVSWNPAPRGGFFLWENGAIRGHAAGLQFPLDRAALESGGFTLIRDPAPVVLARKVAPTPLPASRAQRLIWGTLGALMFVTAGLWYWSIARPDQRPAAAPSQVELNVQKAGKALRLTWTPTLAAIRRATSGIVWIKDGGVPRRMDLDAAELARGSALYVPLSNDVDFRLELIGAGENMTAAVRSVSPQSDAAPAVAAPPPPVAAKPAEKEKPSPIAKRDERSVQTPPRTGLADRAAAAPASPPPSIPPPPPVETSAPAPKAPVPAAAVNVRPPEQPSASPWRHFTRRPSTVTVSYQPAPEPLVRRTLNRVPGVHLIEKVPGVHMIERLARIDNENFVPPAPIASPVPQVPAGVARDLPGEHRIDFRADINKHGGLADLELLSPGTDPRLADLAAHSLERWRFEPARVKGREVSSALIVSFRIRNPEF
ncbi:MAG: hypothetical protein M3O35_08195 [Acidobacteriota bacterium]|nr:hypothetical protein [Acidobacteriota bacterium]